MRLFKREEKGMKIPEAPATPKELVEETKDAVAEKKEDVKKTVEEQLEQLRKDLKTITEILSKFAPGDREVRADIEAILSRKE